MKITSAEKLWWKNNIVEEFSPNEVLFFEILS